MRCDDGIIHTLPWTTTHKIESQCSTALKAKYNLPIECLDHSYYIRLHMTQMFTSKREHKKLSRVVESLASDPAEGIIGLY